MDSEGISTKVSVLGDKEYKKALQTVARMERLFAKGSEIKRKMRARAGLSD